jgi:hypothetical protein
MRCRTKFGMTRVELFFVIPNAFRDLGFSSEKISHFGFNIWI